jgi:hypothetical protein
VLSRPGFGLSTRWGFEHGLRLGSGRVIADLTDDDVRMAVSDAEFAVFGLDPMTYIQCAGQNEAHGVGTLEKQEGSLDRHYRAVDGPLNVDRVTGASLKDLRRELAWQSDFRWERMDLEGGGPDWGRRHSY